MECQCGATVPSWMRCCPQCGRFVNENAPPNRTVVPEPPRYARITRLKPGSGRTQSPGSSSHAPPPSPPKRPSKKPAFVPPEFTLPPGRSRRSIDDLQSGRGQSSKNRSSTSRTDGPKPNLPKLTIEVAIELHGSFIFGSGGKQATPNAASCQLVLVAIRQVGQPVVIAQSKRFVLSDVDTPTPEALSGLDDLRRRAAERGLVETVPASRDRWFTYTYRPQPPQLG